MTGINKRSTAIRLLTEYIRPYSKLLIAALFCMLVAAAAVATVFTFGAAGAVAIPVAMSTAGAIIAGTVATAAVGTAVGLAASDNQVGQKNVEQWNYKENITTTFNPTTGECVKVRVYQNCAEVKKNYCKKWEDPKETRDSVKLLSTGEK